MAHVPVRVWRPLERSLLETKEKEKCRACTLAQWVKCLPSIWKSYAKALIPGLKREKTSGKMIAHLKRWKSLGESFQAWRIFVGIAKRSMVAHALVLAVSWRRQENRLNLGYVVSNQPRLEQHSKTPPTIYYLNIKWINRGTSALAQWVKILDELDLP